jgi:hypothetical protein
MQHLQFCDCLLYVRLLREVIYTVVTVFHLNEATIPSRGEVWC